MGKMIDNPEAYFSQWLPRRTEILLKLEAEAGDEKIPIVGPVVGQLLYLLAKIKGVRRSVELGTATGYSAIFMGEACRLVNGHLTTFEADPEMAQRATSNIESAGLSQWVGVECQDAIAGLQGLRHPVDMIFMDIEKEDYRRALPICQEKLCANGLMVADNTGFKDAHGFNQAIFENPGWEFVNLWALLPGHSPEHDGLCIALKCN